MEPHEFEKKILTALEEGTAGEGKGFVLMPTASQLEESLNYQL